MTKFKNIAILCVFITTGLICGTTNSYSQKAEFGIRLMPTISTFDIQSSNGGTIKGEARIGFGFGALLGYAVSDHVGIQVEAIYTSLNQEFQELDEESRVNLRYLNLPLLISLNTGKTKPVNFNLVAGPQIGISAGSSIKSSKNNNQGNGEPILSVKKGDVGFAYGAGLDFALNTDKTVRLGLGYRGVVGLIDISDNSNSLNTNSYYLLEKTKIQTHSIYVGLSWLF